MMRGIQMTQKIAYQCVVIGCSSGGRKALQKLFSLLPEDFSLPVIVVQHLAADQNGYFDKYLQESCALKVKEADEKEPVIGGVIYLAPANYHLFIESDETLSLTTDMKVNFSRPSIDVLFESAADVYGPYLIGIILTGASKDGSFGLKCIHEKGGLTIVQDPSTAELSFMPRSAIETTRVDYILSLEAIGKLLIKLNKGR
jgi:two-component system chemotaxis response regulator CheB